ncbi:autotransporter outer membrane beta-barrel domain-containing protein [Aquimarina agarilytica]|uniref:autotransporter outer membrane beta-barrel domain-containing protein n=1 Tax=Aquimarina agarilytica TaxID=1087449 RepID=UPI000288B872|nr:autotransporter outer membrane beta-barrel domain-containing protein [Aquimarina agarilytica]
MNRLLFYFLIIIPSLNSYSQISFEKGYYIINSGQKTDCFIKNIDWKNNPTHFNYKLSKNGEIRNASITTIKEFGIYNTSKYIRSSVDIDRSSENLSDISTTKNPIFNKETLFLKVLIEGKASLYKYEDKNLSRYFYSKENSDIQQLVYKSYKTGNKIGENNQFKQQLWIDLKCPHTKKSKLESLTYAQNKLITLFVDYNNCSDSNFSNYEEKQHKDAFHITLRPRFNKTSLSIANDISNARDTDFGNKFSFGFGIEAEYTLPFNKNKWAVFTEPTYQNYAAEKTKDQPIEQISTITYSSIELPIGVRHYFFLNKHSKIFINASYVINFNLKQPTIQFKRPDNTPLSSLEINSRNNFAFGIGYKLKNKYSVELRFFTNRNILSDFVAWNSDYKNTSVILGYTIF